MEIGENKAIVKTPNEEKLCTILYARACTVPQYTTLTSPNQQPRLEMTFCGVVVNTGDSKMYSNTSQEVRNGRDAIQKRKTGDQEPQTALSLEFVSLPCWKDIGSFESLVLHIYLLLFTDFLRVE